MRSTAVGPTGLFAVLAARDLTSDESGCLEVSLEGFGYQWLRAHPEGQTRLP